jgi:hypothetical protein
MASRSVNNWLVNNYCGKTGILSIKFATREQYLQKPRDIYTLRVQMRRNCQRYNVEGISQNEHTQLQHLWYLSDFTIYSHNEYTILWK